MRFAIYHREREYAREMSDPKLAEVDAPTQEEAECITAYICAHKNTNGEQARLAEEKDLILLWQPPCNTQHRN